MKPLFLASILVALAVSAPAADEASLNGKWQLHLSIAGNESDASCTLAQNGNDLSGTCGSEQGKTQLSGKLDNKKVAWAYKIDYNGSPLTLKYTGTLESPTRITGSVLVEEFGVEGEFTATQSK